MPHTPPQPLGFARHDHSGCIRAALGAVEAACARRGLRLTPTRRRVLEILLQEHAALGAYEVLRRLGGEGRGPQPPVAYRALGFLVDAGFAHRIERLNAYVACVAPGTAHEAAFMICRGCGAVAETQARPQDALAPSAARTGFRIDDAVLEAQGVCPACQAAATGHAPSRSTRTAERAPDGPDGRRGPAAPRPGDGNPE